MGFTATADYTWKKHNMKKRRLRGWVKEAIAILITTAVIIGIAALGKYKLNQDFKECDIRKGRTCGLYDLHN